MGKKIASLLLSAALCLTLTGCWDYRGLDQLTIVAGMYVDVSEEDPELLSVVFEIIDMHSTSSSTEPSSEVIVSTGRTIAEAVYKANEKLHNYMYFGNCEIMVISQQVAMEMGLDRLVDPLLRDHQIRDNLYVLVSGHDTASELIAPPESKDYIVSFDLNTSIDANVRTSHSTRALELYQLYNQLKLDSFNVSLPVIRLSPDKDEELQFDGLAIFDHDKLVDFLDQEDMPFFLLGGSKVQGGGYIIQLESGGPAVYATLANRKSAPKQSFSFDGEQFTFMIDITMQTEVSELSHGWDNLEYEPMRQLERIAEAQLAGQVKALAESKLSAGLDLFGFGDTVRNYDYKLWVQVNENWTDWLKNAQVQVTCDVKIDNTGLIKSY